LATDEIADADDDVVPQRRVKTGVVNPVDQFGQLSRSRHGFEMA